MALQGSKKRLLKEVIKYYVDTTGSEYDDFITSLQQTRGEEQEGLDYPAWLAVRLYGMLKNAEISLSDCIENKDIIRSAIKEDESRQGGEFYTPEVWAADGREYLKYLLGDQWGKVNIWDAAAGTGNLLKTLDYPADKVFMSTLLPEDVTLIKSVLPDYEVFQCDFVNDIDYDEYNMRFSEKLPPRLVEILRNNEPLVFYMNPPYKVAGAKSSDVGAHMVSHGMTKCAQDIFHQFMYRILMLKRTYKHTNMYVGVFGPLTMFHSKMIEDLFIDFKSEFRFGGGFCFDAGHFSNTSESVGWVVGYTTWTTKQEGEEDRPVVLDAKELDSTLKPVVIGSRPVTDIPENMHIWCRPKDVVQYKLLPQVTTYSNIAGHLAKAPTKAIGYMMSGNYVIRATRRACIASLPTPDNIPITQENFWRCVASFGVRRVYITRADPFNNSQFYSKPDMDREGFDSFVINLLPFLFFDTPSLCGAYRDLKVGGHNWNISNRLFPMSQEEAASVITDPVLLEDMKNFPAENQLILDMIKIARPHFSPEAERAFQCGIDLLKQSLSGTVRADYAQSQGVTDGKYPQSLQAWDAGIIQLRDTDMVPRGKDRELSRAMDELKYSLYDGIIKYQFIVDTAFQHTLEEDELERAADNDAEIIPAVPVNEQ